MPAVIKKLFTIKFSELIVISITVPLTFAGMAPSVNFAQVIKPIPDLQIESIMFNPDLKILIIEGQTSFPNESLWIDDQEMGEVIQLTTDSNGRFIAAMDDSYLSASIGSHEIIAYVGATNITTPLTGSSTAQYSIDENYNVSLNLSKGEGITLLGGDIITADLKNQQQKYQMKLVSRRDSQPTIYKAISYRGVVFWQTVLKVITYAVILLIIIIAVIRRRRRKKAMGQSFWSLGKGIYFKQDPNNQSPKKPN